MAERNKVVSIKVSKDYFDNFFEPERAKISTRCGIQLTQREFTQHMVNSGAKIVYPKRKNTFAPKNNGRLNFRI